LVTATQAGNTYYLPATASESVTVGIVTKARPTVSLTGAPTSAYYGSTFTVTATSNDGVIPTILSGNAVCTVGPVTGNGLPSVTALVTMASGTGTCTVTARWATNTYYLGASAAQSTTAQRLSTTASWKAPAAISYGTPLYGVLNATGSVPGTFTYSDGSAVTANTVLAAGSYTLTGTFTPTATKDYSGSSASVPLTVNPIGTTTMIASAAAVSPIAHPTVVTVRFSVSNGLSSPHNPAGSVTVTDSVSGASCTDSAITAAGTGSCIITFPGAGPASLTAAYAGNSNNNGSTSSAFAYTVQ
jgi:hypothetical protein